MKSFIPHGRLFTNQIMDGLIYIFNDLNIDLKVANIELTIDYGDTFQTGLRIIHFRKFRDCVLFLKKRGEGDHRTSPKPGEYDHGGCDKNGR